MLTSRQMSILKLIIDDFIETGQPVGSRTLSKKLKLSVSPATIRNDMADLNEYGYIFQPHVSAGRIPSSLGLRYYVDTLMGSDSENTESFDIEGMESLYSKEYERSEKLLQNVADSISDNTNMSVFITAPKISKQRLENMKLVRISSSRALLIFVTDTQDVKTIMIQVDNISQDDLDIISSELLTIFSKSYLGNLDIRKLINLKASFKEYKGFIDYLIPTLNNRLKILDTVRIVKSGIKHVVEYGDFNSIKQASEALLFFDNNKNLEELLVVGGEGVEIKIGEEIGIEELKSFSIIKTNYEYGEGHIGTISLLGPIRMNYIRAKEVITSCSAALSDILSGIHL